MSRYKDIVELWKGFEIESSADLGSHLENSSVLVLPAYAGIIPGAASRRGTWSCAPRMRGDDPWQKETTDDGKWNDTEICAANKDVGFIVRKDGTEVPTRPFKIHCSKKGTHMVPYVEGEKLWSGQRSTKRNTGDTM